LLAVSAEQSTTVQVWSTARLARVAAFSDTQSTLYTPQLGGGVLMLAFSPDGRLLTMVGIDGLVRFYSVPGFSFLTYFQALDGPSSLSFSPNGRKLAIGSADGNVYVYSVPPTYTHLNTQLAYQGVFAASSKDLYSVKFLSDSSLIASGADGVVRFWSLPAGDFTVTIPAQTLQTHWGAVTALSYSARLGLLATASPSGTRIWLTDPARVAANICQTLKAPVTQAHWEDYLPDIPYTPVCG
jgi:WD40 repeat protein